MRFITKLFDNFLYINVYIKYISYLIYIIIGIFALINLEKDQEYI